MVPLLDDEEEDEVLVDEELDLEGVEESPDEFLDEEEEEPEEPERALGSEARSEPRRRSRAARQASEVLEVDRRHAADQERHRIALLVAALQLLLDPRDHQLGLGEVSVGVAHALARALHALELAHVLAHQPAGACFGLARGVAPARRAVRSCSCS